MEIKAKGGIIHLRMTTEPGKDHSEPRREPQAATLEQTAEMAGAAGPEAVAAPPSGPREPLAHARLDRSTRARVLQRMQQTQGNQAVGRALRLQRAGDGANTPAPAVPAEDYVVPFDRSPQSLPGEQVLFNDVFTHATPNDFKLVYTSSGGSFDARDGSTSSKSIAGLNSGNLPFFVSSTWDGKTAVNVQLQVQKTADNSAVRTYTWNFSLKKEVPTTITQAETEGDRALPSAYTYTVGPHKGAAGTDTYLHGTILERFEQPTCNITPDELKPAFKTANPGLTSVQAITNHFWPGGSGSNGTFTVSAGDHIYDQHGGGMPDKSVFEAALITMKEVHHDLPQVYESKPGVTLGRYLIRRILKPDGSKLLHKIKS